jgi:DNA ligase (NAD+)
MNKHINDLVRIIKHLDTLYELGEDCIHPDTGENVSDTEYDMLKDEARQLDPQNALFTKPTASKVIATNIVQHDPPMVSIEKANHEDWWRKAEILFKWLRDRLSQAPKSVWDEDQIAITYDVTDEAGKQHKDSLSVPSHFFVQMYKLDGLAVALYYEKGKLVRAGLRSREGTHGEDVTEQVKYVQGVPTQLPEPVTLSIRGEIICKKSDFAAAQANRVASGEEPFANARACAVGGMRQLKDPSKTKDHLLSFLGYGIENHDNPPYETELARAKWCNQVLRVPFVRTSHFSFGMLKEMEDKVPQLDYRVDGAVVSVNHLEFSEQLGRHGDKATGNPRGKIAWKFEEEVATPVVKGWEVNTGRTGHVVPVIFFEPVQLADTNVSRATMHNWGRMFNWRVDIGTTVKVLKSGNIIPKVIGVVTGQKAPQQPTQCPSCNGPLVLEHTPAKKDQEDVYGLFCYNPDCPAQLLNNLTFFLEKIGAKGLGDAKVGQLIEAQKVQHRSDFFTITQKDCVEAGMGKRQAQLALATIHLVPNADKYEEDDLQPILVTAAKNKKIVPFWKLFQALGVPSAGEAAGKALIDQFKTFDAIRAASVEELSATEGVGTKTAEVIYEFLTRMKMEIDRLLSHIELELPKTGKLTGMIICLSGSFDEGKDALKSQVENLGGKVVGNVSKKCNFLVAGPGSEGKSTKAKELGIPILDVDGLKKML